MTAERESGQPLGRRLRSTRSLCPECLEPIDADVHLRGGQVWLDKHCVAHGEFHALLSSDNRYYFESGPPAGGSFGNCCSSTCAPAEPIDRASSPWSNHSCTVLLEITERCNLSCPTCFADSSPAHSKMMSMSTFRQRVESLLANGKQSADMIQLSGGEPTIHPHLFEMIELLYASGFSSVTLNTNGIKLAQREFVDRLAESVQDGTELFVYLQFDGFEDRTYERIRGRHDLLPLKRRALDNCLARGISVHPVMTLTRGINDHEVGDFVRIAVDEPRIKHVVIQPAMYSGRYDNPRRADRLTLADTAELIIDQLGVFAPEDFGPIPCADPNCHGIAVAIRAPDGLIPISRYFPRLDEWAGDDTRELIDQYADSLNGPQGLAAVLEWAVGNRDFDSLGIDDAEVDRLLDAVVEVGSAGTWDRMLTISIKPFMDAWTYDQDRIDRCCVHILDNQGTPVSLCEFNAIHRTAARTDASHVSHSA